MSERNYGLEAVINAVAAAKHATAAADAALRAYLLGPNGEAAEKEEKAHPTFMAPVRRMVNRMEPTGESQNEQDSDGKQGGRDSSGSPGDGPEGHG